MAFCPICGKDAVEVFCEEHTKDQEPLISDVKPVVLIKCATCDRIKVRGKYTDLKEFDHFLKKHITLNKNANIFEVNFPTPVFGEKPSDFDLPLEVYGTASKNLEPYTEEYEIPIKLNLESCDRCNMSRSTYFEGMLQLRRPQDEVVSYIEKEVSEADDVFISKATDVKGGIDFQFTNQKYLLQLGHELHKKFGGELKVQSKLFTRDHQTSKEVYRLTVLLRLPKFWVGDVIETDKKLARITKMGNLINAFDLRKHKNTTFDCPSDSSVDLLTPMECVVSATKPKITILDPDDYQEVVLSNDVNVSSGDNIRVVQDSYDKWYIVDKT